MIETLRFLRSSCEESKGKRIKVGASDVDFSFERLQSYREEALRVFEKKQAIVLPAEYRNFLLEVGACHVYRDEYGLGFIFHKIEDIEGFTQEVFGGPDTSFPRLLMVVSLVGRGDFGAFDLQRSGPNFTIFSHENPPASWLEQSDTKWVTFSSWLKRLVDSGGEDDLP